MKHIFSKAASAKAFFIQESKGKLEKGARADKWRQTDDRMKDRTTRKRSGIGGGGEKEQHIVCPQQSRRRAAAEGSQRDSRAQHRKEGRDPAAYP